MGTKDLQKKGYFSDSARFADLVNGVVCAGRQVLAASDLTDMDSQTGQFGIGAYDGAADAGNGRNKSKSRGGVLKDRYRDLVRRVAFGMNFMVVGIENQEETDYLMPLRCMSYDTAEYERQAAQIGREIRRADRDKNGRKITRAEFLSGFAKDSRLSPCVTIVLYYGENWDGATSLRELLALEDIPPELADEVNDYRIHLCEVRKFKDTEVFRTDVKQVFDCLRYAEEPDKLYELLANDPAYRQMEPDTYDVIAEYTKTGELMKVKEYSEKEGKVDMCKAITELIERGRRDGLEQGMERGIEQGIERGIQQGIQRGIQQGIKQGVERGKAEGKLEGMIAAITELLEDFGQIPERMLALIQEQTDPAVLSRWLKTAARTTSLAEFEQKM